MLGSRMVGTIAPIAWNRVFAQYVRRIGLRVAFLASIQTPRCCLTRTNVTVGIETMFLPTYNLQMTECTEHFTTITVWKEGHGRMEFRGDGIRCWGLGLSNSSPAKDHIRAHGKRICWAEWLHNSLEGWHTCIFYTGDRFAIVPKHPDYPIVDMLWFLGEQDEKDVLTHLRSIGL